MSSEIIKNVISYIKPRFETINYLEFGINTGATFNVIAPLVNLACAVDINPQCYVYIKHNPNLRWFNMSTDEFIALDLNIDFHAVFIDANHKYEQVLKDFKNTAQHLVENGFIIMHDTYPANEMELQPHICGDAYRAADYIRFNLKSEFEIVTLPGHYGLSLIRKAERTLLWKKY